MMLNVVSGQPPSCANSGVTSRQGDAREHDGDEREAQLPVLSPQVEQARPHCGREDHIDQRFFQGISPLRFLTSGRLVQRRGSLCPGLPDGDRRTAQSCVQGCERANRRAEVSSIGFRQDLLERSREQAVPRADYRGSLGRESDAILTPGVRRRLNDDVTVVRTHDLNS